MKENITPQKYDDVPYNPESMDSGFSRNILGGGKNQERAW